MKRIDGPSRPSLVQIEVQGRQIEAYEGESLAVALGVAGHVHLRDSQVAGTPRGAFCMMGVCQECAVTVDGRRMEACGTSVRAGMVVQLGYET